MKTIKLTSIILITLLTLTACGSSDKGEQNPNKHGLLNTTPKATPLTVKTKEDNKISITLKGSDEDNDTLGYKITNQPTNGKLTGKAPNLTYIPIKDYNGKDSFFYIVNDGLEDSKEAKADIEITPVNDKPEAIDDKATLDEDTNTTINPLANDKDVDIATNNDSLTITELTKPDNGKAVIKDNKIIYTPNPNFNGDDSIEYTIKDKEGLSSIATVEFHINPVNDEPVAKDDSVTAKQNLETSIDALSNDVDIDGDTLEIAKLSQPKHGTVKLKDNKIIYKSNNNYLGKDEFDYTVKDESGAEATAHIVIEIKSNKKDMGLAEFLDNDQLRDTRYGNLHIHGLVKNNNMKDLEYLKLCSKDKCWRVVDKDHPLKLDNKEQITQEYSAFKIGNIAIKDTNETIESIEYKYNGKEKILKLKDKLYFMQAIIDVLYLKFDKDRVDEYLSTVAFPSYYTLIMSKFDFRKKLFNNLIIDIKKGTIPIDAIISIDISDISKEINVDTWSYSIDILNLPTTNNLADINKLLSNPISVKTRIDLKLANSFKIFIPIKYQNINFEKLQSEYVLILNNKEVELILDYIDGQKYIIVETNSTSNSIELLSKKNRGI